MTERRIGDPGRSTILDAIRRNLAESARFEAGHRDEGATRSGTAIRESEPARPPAPLVEEFASALETVAGRVSVVRDEDGAAVVVGEYLTVCDARRLALSDSPLVERVVGRMNTDGLRLERDADRAVLFDCDVGITSAQWAIAETGTIVLDSNRERHRLVSLVPPRHVAIVEAGALRATLAEVLAEAGARGADGLSRTLTFVTGPSRTSDIELTLAIGVHGPGELHVVVVGGDRHA